MATLHVPNLVCLPQFYSRCEDSGYIEGGCVQCGKRNDTFCEDPGGSILTVGTAPLGQHDRHNSLQHLSVRSVFHPEPCGRVEMSAPNAHERTEYNVHED